MKRKEGGRRKKRRIKRRRGAEVPQEGGEYQDLSLQGGGVIPQEDGADLL